jgi:hypothetical protein
MHKFVTDVFYGIFNNGNSLNAVNVCLHHIQENYNHNITHMVQLKRVSLEEG